MRKKCVSCGFICFKTDEVCKRCGSNNLELFPYSVGTSNEEKQILSKPLSFWNYLIYFLLALVIEFVVLFPVLGGMGTSHGSTVSHSQINNVIIVYILHLPTILITWILGQLTDPFVMVFTPITQIIFWTFLFAYLGRRKRIKSK